MAPFILTSSLEEGGPYIQNQSKKKGKIKIYTINNINNITYNNNNNNSVVLY